MITDSRIEDYFPFCMQQGSDASMINKQRIQQLVQQQIPLSREIIASSIKAHLLFLQNGGAGGQWKTIHIKGIVVALYFGPEVHVGKQANFELKQFPEGINLTNSVLPFSNFCASKITRTNFSNADLSYSVLTDIDGVNVKFKNAKLAYTDFTRANLEGANFQNANLIGADFENCILQNADFRGANLRNTRFPGAVLKGIRV